MEKRRVPTEWKTVGRSSHGGEGAGETVPKKVATKWEWQWVKVPAEGHGTGTGSTRGKSDFESMASDVASAELEGATESTEQGPGTGEPGVETGEY